MKIGIIGLPNVGKSSLFNLLTQAHAQVASFPFTTIDRNIGMAPVPDDRLVRISRIAESSKTTCAQIEFVDIAGLIKGASQGEGLGNTFLAHIRDVDLILHVIRYFEDSHVPHANTEVIPTRDHEIVRAELLLADLEMIERRMEKIKKRAECGNEYERLKIIQQALQQGRIPEHVITELPLITTKKEIVVLNLDEDKKYPGDMQGYRLSVKLEEDIIDMSKQEKMELRTDIGAESSGLTGLIEQCIEELSLIVFYTMKGKETRAWMIPDGSSVLDAAGKIHSDMSEGFIKAEVLPYKDFNAHSGFTNAQQAGKTKIEGKDYRVRDGDIIFVKFRI